MKTEADQRKELIQRQLKRHSSGKISTAIHTWQTFAAHLMSIIGEDGFLVLYARSLHLLHTTFPMLPNKESVPSAKSWLVDLETALTGQNANETQVANHQLLVTFTNILASLIGEELTLNILLSAWDDTAAISNPASKEIEDEK